MREANDDVSGVVGLQFEEVAVVDHLDDQLLHVVRLVGIVRYQRVERVVHAIGRIDDRNAGCFLAVAGRQVAHQSTGHHQRFHIVFEREVGHAGLGVVGDRAAEFLGGHFLVSHGLHHFGARHEHVRRILDHQDEVGHRRAIHRASGTGAHDQRDLRHHPGGEHVALEHVGIAAKRIDAFLDAGAARVVEPDHRRADLHRVVHDLADLLRVGFGQRAAEDGEILREHEYQATVDGAIAGDHTVARNMVGVHAEVGAAMLLEHVPFFEAAIVQKQFDALARRELALGVLGIDTLLAATEPGLLALLVQLSNDFLHRYSP